MHLRHPRRAGLSLLEVLIASAVFLFSLVSLGFLMGVAGDMAMDAQIKSQACNLAQTKLAEVAAGAVSLEGQSDQSFEEDPDYTWSLSAEQAEVQSLYNVTVTVARKKANGTTIEVSLSQMVLDPTMVGSIFDTANATTADASTTESATTTDTGTAASSTSSDTASGGASKGSSSGGQNKGGDSKTGGGQGKGRMTGGDKTGGGGRGAGGGSKGGASSGGKGGMGSGGKGGGFGGGKN